MGSFWSLIVACALLVSFIFNVYYWFSWNFNGWESFVLLWVVGVFGVSSLCHTLEKVRKLTVCTFFFLFLHLLSQNESSSSEHSDSDISPLRPVRPRLRFPDVSRSPQEVCDTQDIPAPPGGRETELSSQPRSGREEYHRAIQNLGSAKSRLLSQSLSEPAFSSTPAVSTNHVSALVPEEHYMQDDWLEDDLGCAQPKKKRRVVSEWDSVASRNQNRASGSFESSARGVEQMWWYY